MAWRLTIGGVDQTAVVDSFTTTVALNDRARASVVVGDLLAPRFAELVSYAADGVTPLFGGVILQRGFQGRNPYDPTYQLTLEVGDWFTYTDWCYTTRAYPVAVTLKQVLADLVADHLAAYGITLDPAQVDGPTIAAFTWTQKRVADALRELSDRTAYVVKIDPAKRLRMFVPATLPAPVAMTEAAPHCHELTWRDSDRTPYNTIILRCGPQGVGEAVPYHWVGNASHVYRLSGVAVPASSVWPGIISVDAVSYPIWPPGEGPPDRIEWDYALDAGTLTFIGAAAAFDTVGADIGITYAPQFPFTVTRSTGATPVVELVKERPDVLSLPVAEEIADTLLAQAQEAPREVVITTDQDGFIPGQALTIALPITRSIAGTFLITSVGLTIVQDTTQGDRCWEYTLEAVESSLYQGSYLDDWRAIAGVGGGSTTVTGGGSGGGGGDGDMLPLPAGQIYVGSAGNVAAAVPMSGDIGITPAGVTEIAAGAIVDADIAAGAGIVDTKLATIATPGKVANSATTAAVDNLPHAIITRNADGDFVGRVGNLEAVYSPFNALLLYSANRLVTVPATYRLEVDYAPGFAGGGYTLNHHSTAPDQSYLEVDQLRVRGVLSVYELLVHQIRATNGSIFVSNTGRVKSVLFVSIGLDSLRASYTVETEGPHGFADADFVRAQRFTTAGGGAAVYQSDLYIPTVIDPTHFTAELVTGNPPAEGMDYVRLGNTIDPNRQGSIYMSADDVGAPFIDVLDGVASFADWGTGDKVKARIGNLNGAYGYTSNIYGAALGVPTGAWIKVDPINGVRIGHDATTVTELDAAGNASYIGAVTAAAGSIGGWTILPTYILSPDTNFALNAGPPALEIGNPRPVSYTPERAGIWIGKDGGVYKFRASNVGGSSGFFWDGATATFRGDGSGATNINGGNIQTDTITAVQIAAETITAAEIAARSLTADRIAVGALTATEIAANTITGNNIAANTITGNKIAVNTIDADRLNVSELSAISANLGAVTAGSISGNTIDGGTINGTTITGVSISGSSIVAGSGNTITLDYNGLQIAEGNGTGSARIILGGQSLFCENAKITMDGNFNARRDINVDQDLFVNRNVVASGYVSAAGVLACGTMNAVPSGTRAVYFNFANNQFVFWTGASTARVEQLPWEAPDDPYAVLHVPIVSYAGPEGREVGIVVEALADVAPDAVLRNADGAPDGVREAALGVYLLTAIKAVEARVRALEGTP
jgi:hypothetical protein